MSTPNTPCHGPHRREFLRLGLAGLAGLTWPELLRQRAQAGRQQARKDTALLVVWLHGGASHLETYDPKPDAPAALVRETVELLLPQADAKGVRLDVAVGDG